jgi:hypothetical protein
LTSRDVALIAFRTLALWLIVSNVATAVELLAGWEPFRKASEASSSPLSPIERFFLLLVAALARSTMGVLIWTLAGPLSRLAVPADPDRAPAPPAPIGLYRPASFLVALWLLASTVPNAAYYIAWAVRTGWRPAESDEGTAQMAEVVAKLLLGVALLRGDWLIRAVRHDEHGEATAKGDQTAPP